MTAKHIIEGVMQWTGARNHHQCAVLLDIEPAVVTRLSKGKQVGVRLDTLDQIQRKTQVPIDVLFDWYRLPDGAVLGRIARPAQQ